MRRARIPVLTFAVLTLLVWATRIRNIIGDDEMERPEKVGRVGLALTFATLAVAILVAYWRKALPAVAALVTGLAGWTTGVWLFLTATIFVDPGHSRGFKIVHFCLALVSITLGTVAVWAIKRAFAEDVGSAADVADAADAGESGETGDGEAEPSVAGAVVTPNGDAPDSSTLPLPS